MIVEPTHQEIPKRIHRDTSELEKYVENYYKRSNKLLPLKKSFLTPKNTRIILEEKT